MPSPPPSDLPVVLITGCSSGGIGFELAKALAASGSAKVIATARDVSKMEGLKTLMTMNPDAGGETAAAETAAAKAATINSGGTGILALLPLDVTDDASVSAASARVLELTAGNGCDILINNAGMTFKGTVLDSEVSETARLFDANVFGLLRATKAFVPQMVSRGRGLVVNVGSATGYIHQATKSSYSASKHSVRCLTDTMRIELAPFNVRVILVSPGYVATPIDDKAGEQGRWFAPQVGVSPYAPPSKLDDEKEKASSSSSSSSSSGASGAATEGFKELCTVRSFLFWREKRERERRRRRRRRRRNSKNFNKKLEIPKATRSSIFKYGPGATAGAMLPSLFSKKLSAAILREWKRTSPARGRVTRPPTAREYLSSKVWLPTILGGPVRHWREAPFSSVTWFIGGFLPLWLQDMTLSWSSGLILKK